MIDDALLAECVAAWLQVNEWAGRWKGRKRSKAPCISADEILRRHGITFDGTRALYLAYERAIRKITVPKRYCKECGDELISPAGNQRFCQHKPCVNRYSLRNKEAA